VNHGTAFAVRRRGGRRVELTGDTESRKLSPHTHNNIIFYVQRACKINDVERRKTLACIIIIINIVVII